MSDPLEAARRLLEERRSGALLTDLGDGRRALVDAGGEVIAGDLDPVVVSSITDDVVRIVSTERSATVSAGDREVFVEALAPPSRLAIFGAGPIAEALTAMAATAGFTVSVGDPRPAFVSAERYPAAQGVHVGWPDELVVAMEPGPDTFAVSLLHEARFEDELLPLLLRREVRYLGALGSKRTHTRRLERLTAEGLRTEAERIHGPVGMSIGAVSPEEIAVAILAEMVSVRRGAD